MGLLHYESFISSYKLFITPVIGEADLDSWRGGNQMIHCGELQNSNCRDSLRSCPVSSKESLISDTWDCVVKELWPLQVTGNTGKICVGAGIHMLVFESTEDLTHMNIAGKCLSWKREPDQQPAPPQYEPLNGHC